MVGADVLSELANTVLSPDRAPTELRWSTSAHALAAGASAFESSLAPLARAGHRVRVIEVALPNLAAAELARLDPTLTADRAIAALTTLLELERYWGEAFGFREASFDTVLWTPWTTAIDVELNLRVIRGLGLCESFGGLLRARWRSPEQGLDWQFVDPTVETLHRELAALPSEPESIERALTLLTGVDPRAQTNTYARALGEPELWSRCEQACDVAVRRRLKPIRRPTVHASELAAFTAETRRRFGEGLVLASAPREIGDQQVDVIYGDSAEDVREFLQLTTQATSPNPTDDLDPIKRRIGALLGYPPCCVDAFIRAASSEEDLTERTLLARRFGAGVLDPRWPLVLLVLEHYLPCSLHCERSLALAAALEAAVAEHGVEAPAGGWQRIVSLTDVEHPGNVALLLRERADDEGFDYRVIAINHADDRLAPVLAGDRLEFDGPTITVLRGDDRLHTYVGNVGVFDVEREWGDSRWFAAWFAALVAAASRAAAPRVEPPIEEAASPEPSEVDESPSITTQPASAEQVRVAIERLLPPELALTSCASAPTPAGEHAWIHARLEGDAGHFIITAIPRPLAGGAAFIAGIAARFDPAGQLAIQRSLVAALAERFDPRARTPSLASDAAEVHAMVLAATQPSSGEFPLFAGFAACWPICDADGITRLALVAHGRALELIIAPRAGRTNWPGTTRRCAVGYPSDRELRSTKERAAFARFVQRLRSVDGP